MRFAPPPAMLVADRGGGLNQTSVRSYNERLVMSLLRQFDRLSRMELGQKSGLSAQTISVIVRALERDDLILRGEAQRGRVGPPTIPMSLNPDGAFAIGIKIGAKSTDCVLIDFLGRIRAHREQHYAFPRRDAVLATLAAAIPDLAGTLPGPLRARLAGIGIALPEKIETWPLPGWRGGEAADWSAPDLERRVASILDLPVHIQNDVTAAAGAELVLGAARTLGDFAYFFIGAQTASRLVLNHRIYAGRADMAGGGERIPSLADLDTALAGRDRAPLWQGIAEWPYYGPPLRRWMEDCTGDLAEAIRSLSAFVRLDTILVDGRLPRPVCEEICAGVVRALGGHGPAEIIPGQVGALAKAVGAASLAFHSRFMVENVGLAPA